jgi:hypothetical protein
VIETKAPPPDEFAGEEYGEDWEWPDLPPLVLNKTALTLGAGESDSLTAEIEGEAAEVWWTSNKAGVVSVDEDGKVMAHGQGAAQIKATAKTGGQTAVCTVTVKISAAGLYRNDEASPMDLSEIGEEEDNLLVKSFAYIKENSTEGDAYTIVLDEDINTSAGFNIGSGAGGSSSTGNDDKNKNLTITLQGLDEIRTITKTAAGALFTVYGSTDAEADTPHLILGENITLAGYDTNTSALVLVGYTQSTSNYIGKLTMKTGSRITGNINSTANGGGVYILAGGVFNMDGGSIDSNKSTASAGKGGGVNVAGTFTMNGGEIKDNEAGTSDQNGSSMGGGVYAAVSFSMTGGTISGNKALSTSANNGRGGGVFVIGIVTISGTAAILGNKANNGGGVAIQAANNSPNGLFSMTGGVIAGNTAVYKAAAVYRYNNYPPSFKKTGGVIYGNTEKGNYEGTTIPLANTITSGYVIDLRSGSSVDSPTKYRNTTAGVNVNLDDSTDDNWSKPA